MRLGERLARQPKAGALAQLRPFTFDLRLWTCDGVTTLLQNPVQKVQERAAGVLGNAQSGLLVDEIHGAGVEE